MHKILHMALTYLRFFKVNRYLYGVTRYQKLGVFLVLKLESWISVTLHHSIVTPSHHFQPFAELRLSVNLVFDGERLALQTHTR